MTASPAAWRVAGARVTGASHDAEGLPCEDFYRVEVTDGALIAVVSDGAGSSRRGAEGARIGCETLVAELRQALPAAARLTDGPRLIGAGRAAIRRGIGAARQRLADRARDDNARLADFHATLVGVVALPDRGGLFFHIGDGAGLAMADEGDAWVMSAPANGEFADTTYFYTQEDWRANLRLRPFDDRFATILLMSDGVTDLALGRSPEGAVPHMPFFRPICRFLAANDRDIAEEALHATLDSEAMRRRTGDDKTLVWAARVPA